jgi:hypothetical protein
MRTESTIIRVLIEAHVHAWPVVLRLLHIDEGKLASS